MVSCNTASQIIKRLTTNVWIKSNVWLKTNTYATNNKLSGTDGTVTHTKITYSTLIFIHLHPSTWAKVLQYYKTTLMTLFASMYSVTPQNIILHTIRCIDIQQLIFPLNLNSLMFKLQNHYYNSHAMKSSYR